MINKYYAGIGSRETPSHILQQMREASVVLMNKGYILRSGGAQGADQAFASLLPDNKKEIYLPWKNFENNKSELYNISDEALQTVYKYHPTPNKLSQGMIKLLARDAYQVLGYDLKTYSDFVICYTQNGRDSGGTGQAIRIAIDYKIPIYNLFYKEHQVKLNNKLFELQQVDLDAKYYELIDKHFWELL